MNISCFGCSFTWGIELPSRDQAWPAQLENHLPAKSTNLGIPGASNRSIARMLMTHLVDHQPDAVVIMWTYPGRYEFVIENNNFVVAHSDSAISLDQQPIPSYFSAFSKDFFKFTGNTDSALIYDSLMSICHAKLLLESRQIPYVFCRVHDLESTISCHPNIKKLFDFYMSNMLLFENKSFEQYARDIGSWGKSHPLSEAHSHAAKIISQDLIEKTNAVKSSNSQ